MKQYNLSVVNNVLVDQGGLHFQKNEPGRDNDSTQFEALLVLLRFY